MLLLFFHIVSVVDFLGKSLVLDHLQAEARRLDVLALMIPPRQVHFLLELEYENLLPFVEIPWHVLALI